MKSGRWSRGWPLVALGVLLPALATASGPHTPLAKPATLSDIDHAIEDLGAKEGDLKAQLERSAQQAEELKARSIARGRAYVRIARSGLLPVSGGFEALVDHAVRLERLRRALMRDLEQEKELVQLRQALNNKLISLHDTSEALSRERGSFARSHAAIAAAEEREQAFQRAFMGQGYSPGPHTAVYGADLEGNGSVLPPGGIAALKGRLPFPIAGRAELRKVGRSAKRGPGLEMLTHLGAPARAIYAGRVAFADSYGDYGKTVIVDHGGRYYSVSANLSDIAVEVGDEVAFGERLGSVASSPRAGDQGAVSAGLLYFELRVDGEPRELSDWFGI